MECKIDITQEGSRVFWSGFWTIIGSILLWYCIVSLIVSPVYNAARNHYGWGVDDSDLDGRNRSGLIIYTDYKTGVQYVGNGSGITPRVNVDGSFLIWEGDRE